jgi:hypothetical protein
MPLLIKIICPRKNKESSYKDTSDREIVRITYQSPVSIKQEKLKGRIPNGIVCFVLISQNQIWFNIYTAVVVTLVVTI